jgi:hypothetical protein
MTARSTRLRVAGRVVLGTAVFLSVALVFSWRDSWWWVHTLVPGTLGVLALLVLGYGLTVAGERVEARR